MNTVIVIPARYSSSRFPGKPLAVVAGKTMLERTWLIATAVGNADRVVVATDDERISRQAQGFGAQVVMTPATCENGTERVYEAIQQLAELPEIVINLQGDALLTPPWAIEVLIDAMHRDDSVGMATIATRLKLDQYREMSKLKAEGIVSGTTVVFDRNCDALYFSKALIPFVRHPDENLPVYRHIGLYGYRLPALRQYLSLAPTPLEKVEGLEMLRMMENAFKIRVVPVDYRGRTHWSVDSKEDILLAEQIIVREGELVTTVCS